MHGELDEGMQGGYFLSEFDNLEEDLQKADNDD